MNTPVSLPLAKLLKEKGFDEPCPNLYYEPERCKKPTIADVVMWLYKNHKIWISVDPEIDTNTWFHTITHGKSMTAFGNYSGPIEAYEKGFEHILNEMI